MAEACGYIVRLGILWPSATNLVAGIADSNRDHARLLALAGQSATRKLRKENLLLTNKPGEITATPWLPQGVPVAAGVDSEMLGEALSCATADASPADVSNAPLRHRLHSAHQSPPRNRVAVVEPTACAPCRLRRHRRCLPAWHGLPAAQRIFRTRVAMRLGFREVALGRSCRGLATRLPNGSASCSADAGAGASIRPAPAGCLSATDRSRPEAERRRRNRGLRPGLPLAVESRCGPRPAPRRIGSGRRGSPLRLAPARERRRHSFCRKPPPRRRSASSPGLRTRHPGSHVGGCSDAVAATAGDTASIASNAIGCGQIGLGQVAGASSFGDRPRKQPAQRLLLCHESGLAGPRTSAARLATHPRPHRQHPSATRPNTTGGGRASGCRQRSWRLL